MSDDRELLELAARAVGINLKFGVLLWSEGSEYPYFEDTNSVGDCANATPVIRWNPLNDDGDAFKLATSLGISVLPYPIYDEPKHSALAVKKRLFPMPEDSAIEIYGDDPCAATRRAIVRIAANLARG